VYTGFYTVHIITTQLRLKYTNATDNQNNNINVQNNSDKTRGFFVETSRLNDLIVYMEALTHTTRRP